MSFKRFFSTTKIVKFGNGKYGIRRGSRFSMYEFYDFGTRSSVISSSSWNYGRETGAAQVDDLVLVRERYKQIMCEFDIGHNGMDVTKGFDVLVAEYKLSGLHKKKNDDPYADDPNDPHW